MPSHPPYLSGFSANLAKLKNDKNMKRAFGVL